MYSIRTLAALTLAAAFAVACQAPVMPLSAQQGSSLLVPMGTIHEVEWSRIGYGGLLKADTQRGTMVYRLDGPTGTVLPTYTTTVIPASPASAFGRFGNDNTAAWMVVSLVDVPVTAPLGTHSLYVTHEVGTEVDPIPYAGVVKILPNQIVVNLPGGGTETIIGAVTRISGALSQGGPFGPFGAGGGAIIPDPQLVLWSGAAHALELEVTYPTAIMNVEDAFERIDLGKGVSHPALVFYDDDATAGVVRISAVSGNDEPLSPIAVAFTLTGGTRLDPANVDIDVELAADANGTPFTYEPSAWIE